jgi:tetratricopeptide (TPR) repeat protein
MNASLATVFAQGVAALRAGDLDAAESLLLSVVEQDAAAHEAWQVLSVVAVRGGFADIGVERARRAVALDRRNADYLNSLGVACTESEDIGAAEQAFRRALKIRPAFAEAHYNLGKVLRNQGKLAESLREYERAHALEPLAVPIQLGLAMILRLNGKSERALAMLRVAMGDRAPDPDHIPYFVDCLSDVEGPAAALAWLQDLLARQPDSQQAHHILGRQLLSLGRWRDGWAHYLWRAHRDPERMRTRPALLPPRLEGKRVYLRAEEGIGDILFFLRFAAELGERGASIALECPPHMAKLAPLLAGRVPIAEPAGSDLPVWIVDLPAVLQSEATPPPFPLTADASQSARAREKLARLGPRPYLGLTWRAGTDMRRARALGASQAGLRLVSKEVPPEMLGAVARGWPGTVVSLQRGPAAEELRAIRAAAGAEVHDLAAVNEDLRETLAVLAELDEYAGVINTNMHLLAGLGRTARALVPRPLDWRWMREGASAWFPGFPVYRQPADLSWSGALTQLRQDLEESRKRLAA